MGKKTDPPAAEVDEGERLGAEIALFKEGRFLSIFDLGPRDLKPDT
jgi:hypothetical protein